MLIAVLGVAAEADVSPAQGQYYGRTRVELVRPGFDHDGEQFLADRALAPLVTALEKGLYRAPELRELLAIDDLGRSLRLGGVRVVLDRHREPGDQGLGVDVGSWLGVVGLPERHEGCSPFGFHLLDERTPRLAESVVRADVLGYRQSAGGQLRRDDPDIVDHHRLRERFLHGKTAFESCRLTGHGFVARECRTRRTERALLHGLAQCTVRPVHFVGHPGHGQFAEANDHGSRTGKINVFGLRGIHGRLSLRRLGAVYGPKSAAASAYRGSPGLVWP